MNVTVNQRQLKAALDTAGRVITRSPLPIQSCFLLKAQGNELQISGADYDGQIVATIPAEVEKEGAVTAVAATLRGLIDSGFDVPVNLRDSSENGDGSQVTLMFGLAEYELQGLPAEEFPPIWDLRKATSFNLPAGILRDGIQKTLFAASDDPSRPQLTGLNIVIEGSMVKVCGASMASLSLFHRDLDDIVSKDPVDVIVPGKLMGTLEVALKSLGDAETVEVSATRDQIFFRLPGLILLSRLIDGKFPNFEKVIPKDDFSLELTFERESFRTCLRRALVTSGDSKRVQLGVNGKVTLRSESGGTGRGNEDVAVQIEKSTRTMDIAFDGKVLADYVAQVEEDTFTALFTAPLSPGVFRSGDWTYVQMPMHLI